MAVTDLTGTKWLFGESISEYVEDVDPSDAPLAAMLVYTSVKDSQATYWGNINFSSNGQNFIAIGGEESVPLSGGEFIEVWNSEWEDESYRTITITGGTDATNPNLIAWLEANAEQIIEPSANEYTLTQNLTNLTSGNITLQITPDTDYTYPTSLTITNGTLVSYDNTTGIAVINGDDTTIVSGECVEQASGYNLTVSGAFEGWSTGNLGSKVTIDNTTCSVDYLGNTTNIPHTFTGVTTFEIEPNGDTFMPNICYCKIISGSGTCITGDYMSGHAYQAGDEIGDAGYRKIIITMTSDTVIQLGYCSED